MAKLQDGTTIKLYCLGHLPGATWLYAGFENGKPVPRLGAEHAHAASFRVEGGVSGSDLRLRWIGGTTLQKWYLDGRTLDGTVGIAGPANSGTWWKAYYFDGYGGSVRLDCQGHLKTPDNFRWLDGRTTSATIGLAPNVDYPRYSGTRWIATPVATPLAADVPPDTDAEDCGGYSAVELTNATAERANLELWARSGDVYIHVGTVEPGTTKSFSPPADWLSASIFAINHRWIDAHNKAFKTALSPSDPSTASLLNFRHYETSLELFRGGPVARISTP